MRIAGTGILAGLALATLVAFTILVLAGTAGKTNAATGTHDGAPGSIASFSVDTDTTGNTAPDLGAAQLQGTINACKVVTNGSTFDVDFILDEVNPADKTSGGQFDLAYDGSVLTVNSLLVPAGAIDFTTTVLPDNSGAITPAWASFGTSPDGEVNFVRITFEATGPGTSILDISNQIVIFGSGTGEIPVSSVADGSIAVGGTCSTVTTPPVTGTPTGTPTITIPPTITITPSTGTPTDTPSPTATPTPTPTTCPGCTPAPTPTPSPTPTEPVGDELIWGDNNCSDEPPDPVDSLLALRHDGGLSTNTSNCPAGVAMGETVEVSSASPHPWGDTDCSGEVNPIDSLKILRFDAGLSVDQPGGCPEIGDTVLISVP